MNNINDNKFLGINNNCFVPCNYKSSNKICITEIYWRKVVWIWMPKNIYKHLILFFKLFITLLIFVFVFVRKKYFSFKEYLYNFTKIFCTLINLDNIRFAKQLFKLIYSCLWTTSNRLFQSNLLLPYLYWYKIDFRCFSSLSCVFYVYNNIVCISKYYNFHECSILYSIVGVS